ncbi:MAG: D-alanyl-D-alanine carboxypeptidase [Cyanobacteria bacterium J06629_19]
MAGIDFGEGLLKKVRLGAKLIGLGVSAAAASILLSAWFGVSRWERVDALNLGAVDIRPKAESAWVREIISKDPAAKAIVSGYVSGLSSAGYGANRQGVWVSVGQFPVAENQGTTPLPAASLTKIATTLAALSTWSPSHRFETLVGWQGDFDAATGTVSGDLVIEGSDDPLFVWEEAIALGNTLNQLGVRRVTGDLVIAGPFNMNFETSTRKSGALLKQAFNASEWNYEVEVAHQNLSPGTPLPQIAIAGSVKTDPNSRKNQVSGWLVRHDSLPLVAILKAMNIYSNNPMAEQVSKTVGGPTIVIDKVEAAIGITPGEVKLINGSGLGEENQISPRAAVLMLQKIQEILRSQNLTISDIFPVAGADGGTIVDRGLPANAVVKTGSLAVVSALAGAMPTEDKGIVWFSLINYGAGLDALRSRQDQVISALEQQWGKASGIPPELKTTVVIGQAPYQFGTPERNVSIFGQ